MITHKSAFYFSNFHKVTTQLLYHYDNDYLDGYHLMVYTTFSPKTSWDPKAPGRAALPLRTHGGHGSAGSAPRRLRRRSRALRAAAEAAEPAAGAVPTKRSEDPISIYQLVI